jgi:acyl-CoA synthetase (AMP-forming)/AMP-acid ligase II
MTTEWTFADVWEAVADAVPDAPAQRHGDAVTTWRTFDRIADGVAAVLLAQGLVRQDRVALYLHNGPEYMQAAFACLKAALVPVNTNYRYLGDELAELWRDADAAAVIFHGAFAPRIEAIRARCPGVRVWLHVDDGSGPCPPWAQPWSGAAARADARVRAPWGRSGDDLILIYTGGTTGRPRGVMWRQHDLFLASNTSGDPEQADLAGVGLRVRRALADGVAAPVGLPAAPLMHGTAFVFAATVLNRGGTLVTLPGPGFDAARLLDAIAAERVTDLCFVGDAFGRPIVDALDAQPQRWSVRSLRAVSSSGMAWSADNKARLLVHAPDAVLIDFLNSSEASGMGRSVASRRRAPEGARFRLGEHAFVVDEQLRPVAPGSGTVGRVAVRGRVPLGYHKDPQKTAATFPVIDGVRCAIPGDYALVEADGSIRLLGRGSVSINTGGEKVYPDEVEACIKELPGVRDALVVGVPDERFGERVAALVEPVDAALAPVPAAVGAHVAARLAGHKVPRTVLIVGSIGRGPNGKADYPAARRRLLAALGGAAAPCVRASTRSPA